MKKKSEAGYLDNTVIIRRCGEYDREKIASIVSDGMKELNYEPRGKVLVKPNVVFAGKAEIYGTAAYTNTEALGGVLKSLGAGKDVTRIDVGETTAVGFPTRWAYSNAGYYNLIKKIRKEIKPRLGIYCMEEDLRDTANAGGIVHNSIRLSRKMMRSDTMVYVPKLKYHCVTTMTGAVKLNIGICSSDNRSIRHDYMLHDKIVDLLAVGYPDFTVMDAIDIGAGNEAFPKPVKLGLIIMGRNPLAVDIVGAFLLGFSVKDVPYLARAVERGYTPGNIDEIKLSGDITNLNDLRKQAKKLNPDDPLYTRWNDISLELERLNSPMRFFWGKIRHRAGGKTRHDPHVPEKCGTGCVMGIKMFLAFYEKFAGEEGFRKAKPVIFVAGEVEEEIDARGGDVFLIGNCAQAPVKNPGKIIRMEQCFVTAGDLSMHLGFRLGMPNPIMSPGFLIPMLRGYVTASIMKTLKLRYAQDAFYFIKNNWMKKI